MSHKRIALVVLFVLAALPLSRVDAQLRRGNAAPQNQTSQLTLTPAAGAQAAQGAKPSEGRIHEVGTDGPWQHARSRRRLTRARGR